MKPVSPVIPDRDDLVEIELRIGEGQEEVQPLPALSFNDGSFHVSRWELSDEDLEELKRSRSIYFFNYTQNKPPYPVWLDVRPPLVMDHVTETPGEELVM